MVPPPTAIFAMVMNLSALLCRDAEAHQPG